MTQTDRTELVYRIALTMVPTIGPVTARKLIRRMGSARTVFGQTREALESIRGIGPRMVESLRSSALLGQAEKEMEFMDRHRIRALWFEDPEYPDRLNQCEDGPILLFVKGSKDLQFKQSLSVVGTRQASSYGRDLCREIIKGLAEKVPGLVIVSGLAYGIDVISHRAALEYGLPTLAVLGHGMSTLYPSSHRETAKRIIRQGALLTDFHSGTGPERNNFLRRNRIIAGLSQATLVVESARRGGALITASMASSYSRDVLAVPGRVGDIRSSGCNHLIKSNLAAITESAEDVLRHLNWDVAGTSGRKPLRELGLTPAQKKLLHVIENAPGLTPEALGNHAGIPIHTVLSLLLEMELKGWISAEAGNCYRSIFPGA